MTELEITTEEVNAYAGQDTNVTSAVLVHAPTFVLDRVAQLQPPADKQTAQTAIKQAAIAQAATWALSGLTNPIADRISKPSLVSSATLNGATLQYADAQTQADYRAQLLSSLCDSAAAILYRAGYTRRKINARG